MNWLVRVWQSLEPESTRGRLTLIVGFIALIVTVVTASGIWYNATKTAAYSHPTHNSGAKVGGSGIANSGAQTIYGPVSISGQAARPDGNK